MISVITVARNAAATLEATIRSVLDQTYDDIEYIVIDGASTDGTLAIIDRYRDGIQHWVSEPDEGIYDAMNKGIAAARGEWILFLNSGDTLAGPTVLADIFSRDSLAGEDIVYGNTVQRDRADVIRPPSRITRWYFFFETICHQSLFAKRELFERVGRFRSDLRVIADREWLLRVATAGGRFAHVDVNVCVWDAEGFSSANRGVSSKEVSDLQSRYFSRVERALLPWRMRFRNLGRRMTRPTRPASPSRSMYG